MKFKLCALAFAASALVAGTAQADVLSGTTAQSGGNSSVLFVAIDANNNTGLVIDLGLSLSDFVNSTTFTSGLTSPVTWNFLTNATTLSTTDNQWSDGYSTFKASQAGGDFQWGVIASDSNQNLTVSATNIVAGRGLLATGNVTQAQITGTVSASQMSTATSNLDNFISAARNGGTMIAANNGSTATTSTTPLNAWLPDTIGGTFTASGTGGLAWNYLLGNGASSTFQYQRATSANPTVTQFGGTAGVDVLSADPITFSFDIATNTLVLAPAIPEPGTYAMLLAGLAAVGFVARRRKAN